MNNKSQPKNIENTKNEELSQGKTTQNRELFNRAIEEALEQKIQEIEENLNTAQDVQPDKRTRCE